MSPLATAVLSIISGTALTSIVALVTLGPTVRKLRAETSRVDIDAAVAEDRAEDEHWAAIVRAQAEDIVQPLRQDVTALRQEVSSLRAEVESVRTRYWRAIAHIRALVTWSHRTSPDAPGMPVAPAEIAADI